MEFCKDSDSDISEDGVREDEGYLVKDCGEDFIESASDDFGFSDDSEEEWDIDFARDCGDECFDGIPSFR